MSKVVVVAGMGPGIGLAVAKRFAREGYKAALIARDARKLADHVQEIVAAGGVAEAFPADLCYLEALKQTFATIQARLGPAEILVYNGARWHEAPAMQLDPMIFNWDLALCATGALACAQHVYPAMKSAGRGTMLFTGGGLALHPEYGKGVSSLTAGKSALRGLVFAMAGELSQDNIHAATVTVAGQVAAGTAFDRDMIAEQFWQLHRQPRATWETERIFRGS